MGAQLVRLGHLRAAGFALLYLIFAVAMALYVPNPLRVKPVWPPQPAASDSSLEAGVECSIALEYPTLPGEGQLSSPHGLPWAWVDWGSGNECAPLMNVYEGRLWLNLLFWLGGGVIGIGLIKRTRRRGQRGRTARG